MHSVRTCHIVWQDAQDQQRLRMYAAQHALASLRANQASSSSIPEPNDDQSLGTDARIYSQLLD